MKRVSLGAKVAAAVAAGVLLVGVAPAQAAAPGTGAFTGYEVPPSSTTFTNMLTLCARFNATAGDPLVHELDMVGTFHGATGAGHATFRRTTSYFANPEGTYNDANCTSPGSVTGSVTINFAPYSCNGTGTYTRRASSVYALTFSGSCTNGTNTYATGVTFVGSQVICSPITGCLTTTDPNAAAEMAGSYVQTG